MSCRRSAGHAAGANRAERGRTLVLRTPLVRRGTRHGDLGGADASAARSRRRWPTTVPPTSETAEAEPSPSTQPAGRRDHAPSPRRAPRLPDETAAACDDDPAARRPTLRRRPHGDARPHDIDTSRGDRARRPRTPAEETEPSGDVGVLAVPTPGAGEAVITVKVGSDRTGITGVTQPRGGRAAAEHGRQRAERHAARWRRGHRGRLGEVRVGCRWRLFLHRSQHRLLSACEPRPPVLGRPGERPGRLLREPELCAPGPGPAPAPRPPYQFRTGTGCARAGRTRRRTRTTSCSPPAPQATASGGIWQQSRTNPTLQASCGLDVALILDLSGSVGDPDAR